jgi:thiamine biosynthesis lipoprotein
MIRAILLLLLLSLPSCDRDAEPYIRQTFVMGTRGTITIYGLPEEKAQEAAAAAAAEMHRIESVMSTWKEDSEISRLNAESQGEPFQVSPELAGLLARAGEISAATAGAFDVTARPVVRLWGFQGGEAKLPTDEEIADALATVGWEKMAVDLSASTVTLAGGATLDVAGIGKGYAVDRCVEILIDHEVTSGLVDLGGNMYAIGTPPGRDAWSIGIRDPKDPKGVIGKLMLTDEAVATSGNYENYVVINGRKYGHIVDPRSGSTVEHVLGVTVISKTATDSDALSTALFVLGPEGGKEIPGTFPGTRAVFALPDDTFEFTGDFGGKLELFD